MNETINKLIEFSKVSHWSKKMANGKSETILTLKKQLHELTKFLPSTASNAQRMWHILNDSYYIVKCEYCNAKPVKYYTSIGYARFCSKKCSANAESSKNKVRETNLKR